MAEVIWTKKAEKDLIAIHEFISIDSVFYANRFIRKLITRVDILKRFPESGHVVPEKEDFSIRELKEGNYRIFYQVEKNNIRVLRIHHSSRNIK